MHPSSCALHLDGTRYSADMALSMHVAGLAFAPALAPALPRMARAAAPVMEASEAMPFLDRAESLGPKGVYAGDVGFDPLGLSGSPIPLEWMREAEIKHGRVCMLATVGWLAVDTGLRAPGVPKDLAALNSYQAHDLAVTSGPLIVLLILCGVFAVAGFAAVAASMTGTRVPGDFMLTGGYGKTPEAMAKLKQAEIKHCRLAMMAFSGLQTQCALAHGEIGFPYF